MTFHTTGRPGEPTAEIVPGRPGLWYLQVHFADDVGRRWLGQAGVRATRPADVRSLPFTPYQVVPLQPDRTREPTPADEALVTVSGALIFAFIGALLVGAGLALRAMERDTRRYYAP